jgi:membrane-bound lytic murein transglycosylase D
MIKKEMTKRHLITCSVIVVLVIISTLNIYSVMGSKKTVVQVTKPADSVSASVHLAINYVPKNVVTENDFSFANEALPINDASVKRKLARSLVRHNFKYVQSNILQNKAGQLFPVIEPILRAYGIPEDFKYLALVESGFGEGASPRGAKGVWQFMPGTARTYGLKVRDGVDERMNVRKSTVAACKYIKELYVEFNSWTLAAAAYNNGEIQIERAINRQNEDNYFLMHLNGETAAYVYNIIAMKQIICRPGKYGYKVFLKPTELFAFN